MNTKTRKIENAVFPMSSMIDIVFLLIIFFVVTSSIDKEIQDEKVRLANAPWGKPASPLPCSFVVNIHANGETYVAGRKVSSGVLSDMLSNSAAAYGEHIPVIIRGDKETMHGNIKSVMESIQRTGLYRVRFQALKEK